MNKCERCLDEVFGDTHTIHLIFCSEKCFKEWILSSGLSIKRATKILKEKKKDV